MTWKHIFILTIVPLLVFGGAPFVELNTIHQAYSEFEVNLIFNQNRNVPILLVTLSRDDAKDAVKDVLKQAFSMEPYGGFGIIVDCRKFDVNLNNTLGLCNGYSPDQPVEPGNDPNFFAQFLNPVQMKIRAKGHSLMKNHKQQYLQGKTFNAEYLSQVIKKNIADFVTYIEDQYDLDEFLHLSSQFKSDRKPKLVYFDENLLAPPFLKKLTAMLDGRMDVGVTDDLTLLKNNKPDYDEIYLLEYDYSLKNYQIRQVTFDIDSPINTILEDSSISQYRQIKKNRNILLDFQHAEETIYHFDTLRQIYNLQSHSRIIILEVSQQENQYDCSTLKPIAQKYETLFNYVCFSRKQAKLLPSGEYDSNFLFIIDQIQSSPWVQKKQEAILSALPQAISRQRVSSETQAQHCLKTAAFSQRDPIFFYFSEKAKQEKTYIINYLNSLPEVTSLQYFCQIYLPDQHLKRKFSLQQDTIFTMFDPDKNGNMKKMQHSKIRNFMEIKMFLREIAIQKMLKVYEEKLMFNNIVEIKSAEEMTEQCFNKKCIIGLIATGRYRENQQINMLKEVKLTFEDRFKFVWIDGICHWDIAKQLKILKKKEKVIDRSYVFFYDEKDTSFSQWKSNKFWDKKDLERWVKSLRNSRQITHLKFALDMQERTCEKKKVEKMENSEL